MWDTEETPESERRRGAGRVRGGRRGKERKGVVGYRGEVMKGQTVEGGRGAEKE